MIVDDYFRYTWVLFLANKNDAIDAFKVLCKKIQNEKGYALGVIMEESLKIMHLRLVVMILVLSINFHHLELHSKIELLREIIDPFKKWLGLC